MHTLQGSTGKREKNKKKKQQIQPEMLIPCRLFGTCRETLSTTTADWERGESGGGFGGMLGHGSCCLRFCELIWQPVSAHFSGTYAHKRKTEVISTKLPDKQRESVAEVGVVMGDRGMTEKEGMLMGLVTSLAAI